MQKLIARNILKKSVLRIEPSTSATKSASFRSITPTTRDTVKKSVLLRQSMNGSILRSELNETLSIMLNTQKSVNNTRRNTGPLTEKKLQRRRRNTLLLMLKR